MAHRSIVILTGAGISKESGLDTFRDADGLWAKVRIEDVATPEAFARDPARVHAFYNERRRGLRNSNVQPNAAHRSLAELERRWPGEILLVTQNIDDLHERAGSQAVIHLQGELLKARCTICGKVSERYDDITEASDCPICGNAGHLRPHIVWVGEEPLRIASVYQALAHASLFLAIGAAIGNEPAQSFLAEARRAGARTVELNRDLAPYAEPFDERITGPLAETVPAYVKKLIAEG